MTDENKAFIERARADFSRARLKAFANSIWSLIQGQPNQLLSYDDIKEKLRIGGPIYRGVQTVPVKQIAGSLNRYHQFDRAFLPTQGATAERWQRVNLAFYSDVSLPPVVLYKVGEVYFVVDGHHRVSVAREQGQLFIEAEIRECATKVNLTANIRMEDLEILSEKVDFIERTNIDQVRPEANIKLNIPDGFIRMLEHIAVHKYFMGIEQKRDISDEEAIGDWYDKVYLPILQVIRESSILEDFPQQTEGDLYLWVLDHQHYLHETNGLALLPPEDAARDYIKTKKDVDEELE
ncbi:MAG: hypothetical protein RBS68_05100 [Anaerolineales bacterium]|jgi:hypothetical protein|nr:hypothetical protein [Anaerolineales bacterium]